MLPKLSIIIPCYQAETTLEATLQSLAGQRFREWECLVVNDGSTDGSVAIAERHARLDRRLRIIHQANAGVSAARNTGIAHASGTYVHFLDADDLVYPEGYQGFVACLEREPAASVCYCSSYHMVDLSGTTLALHETADVVDFSRLLESNFGPPVCAVVRRSMIERVCGFEHSLSGLADWDFWLRVARAGGQFTRVLGTLVGYRVLPGSMSKNARRMYQDALLLRSFLATPDKRIRADESGDLAEVSAALLRQASVNDRSFALGGAVVAEDGDFAQEILTEIQRDWQPGPESLGFSARHFCWGVKYTAGSFHLISPTELGRLLRRIYEGVQNVEREIGCPDLLEAVLETLLAPGTEAARERDRLLASTSYKLGRVVTRCKFW